MKTYRDVFMQKHGERLIFGGLALVFALLFVGLACIPFPIKEGPQATLFGAANTILIGLAMTCYNKARGSNGDYKDVVKPLPKPKEPK